jgi:hypothetical protein
LCLRHLGAASRAQPRTGLCDVPFGAPSEPLAVIRYLRRQCGSATSADRVSTQRPGTPGPRGHVVDRIAVSYQDGAAAVARLKTEGVRSSKTSIRSATADVAMIEGPDAIAIEPVEKQ